MSKPLPCPFCGSVDLYAERGDFSTTYVFCGGCGAHGPTTLEEWVDDESDTTKERAFAQWNDRHNATAPIR